MHWAQAYFDLPDDADERAVRRAYAARLRTTRPDEDAEGFQRLHEAYRQALEWVQLPLVQRGAQVGDDDWDDALHDHDEADAADEADAPAPARRHDADGEPEVVSRLRVRMPAPGLQPSLALGRPIGWSPSDDTARPENGASPSHAGERFDAPAMSAAEREAFFWTLHRHANSLAAPAFRDWLHAQPALYPLGVKDEMAMPLALFLDAEEPIGYKQLMITLHFFGLDTVSRATLAVQEPLLRIQRKAFRDSDDPRADQIEAELGQRERTGTGGGGGAWTVWFGIVLFSVLARCASAAIN